MLGKEKQFRAKGFAAALPPAGLALSCARKSARLASPGRGTQAPGPALAGPTSAPLTDAAAALGRADPPLPRGGTQPAEPPEAAPGPAPPHPPRGCPRPYLAKQQSQWLPRSLTVSTAA